MMSGTDSSKGEATPVQEARAAIWRLFEQGYVDEDMATAGLLAVDLGTRRSAHPVQEQQVSLTRAGRRAA
jgi:hypothetical protein